MFGKVVIEVDKASIISAIAFVGASCACLIISNGLMMFIRGNHVDRWARFKGFLMLSCGLSLLAANLTAVMRSDVIIKKLAEYLTYINL